MAKELPYFKFEPSEWENGNIQMCSTLSKGLFIDICSIYWARIGELPYALALQKLCRGDATQMQELISYDIIYIKNDFIIIDFLDEQLKEFKGISERRKDAANKRWQNNDENANVMQMHSKSNAIREDKIRVDEKKEEKIINVEKSKIFLKPTLLEVSEYCIERKNNINPNHFVDYYQSNGWMVGKVKMKDWKATVRTWEKNNFNQKQNATTSNFTKPTITDRTNAAIERLNREREELINNPWNFNK